MNDPRHMPPGNNGQVPSPSVPVAAVAAPPAPTKTNPAPADGAVEELIRVAGIDPDPRQPRKFFDPERDKELQDSIRAHGQLNAIIVYQDPATGRYRLIAGERRWRACQRLGQETIRARILQGPPDEAKLRELALLDNEQRQDLSDIERGLAYLEFMTGTACTASALAQKIGKSVSTVTRAVALIKKLPEDLRASVGVQLPPTVAQVLTMLPGDDDKRHFAALYCRGTITTGEDLAAAIRRFKSGQVTAPGDTAGSFTCEEEGCKIAVTLPPGGNLATAEAALRIVLKDLKEQAHRGLDHWKAFLSKKKAHARKGAELKAAQDALTQHATSGN